MTNIPASTTQRSRIASSLLRWLRSVLVVVAVFASQIADAEPAAAQVDAGRGSVSAPAEVAFEMHRLGGADRYDTSWQIAHEIVGRAGGSVEGAVVASGVSWLDAAVGASLAGGIDAPLLLMPPDGLRPAALSLLSRAGVTKVLAVGGVSVIPDADLGGIRELGVNVERVGTGDPIATALAAAALGAAAEPAQSAVPGEPALAGTPDTVGGLGAVRAPPSRAVVLASIETSEDAHVAAPFAARAQLPLLFTSPDSLDETVARFVDDRAITHVVVTGAHGPLSDSLRNDIDSLDVSVVQIGGFGLVPASAAAASLSTDDSTGEFAAWTRRPCPPQSPRTVGLASSLDVWDAFSAAPLLGQLCAPLLLTVAHELPVDSNAVLYRAQHTGTTAVHVFGGPAAVRDAVLGQAAEPQVPIRVAAAVPDPSLGNAYSAIAVIDERLQMRHHLIGSGLGSITNLRWSPQQRHLAFAADRDGTDGVFVYEHATGDLWQVTPINRNYHLHSGDAMDWSDDGALLAANVGAFEDANGNRVIDRYELQREVLVADIRARSVLWLARGNVRSRQVGWSPAEHRLVVFHESLNETGPFGGAEAVNFVDVDTRRRITLDHPGNVADAKWSPDAAQIALITANSELRAEGSDGIIHVLKADGTAAQTANRTNARILECVVRLTSPRKVHRVMNQV